METSTKTISKRSRSRARCPDGTANPIDVYVGQRLTLRRKLLHISQEALARSLGLTFQQIQKYEKGMNRISASRLWDVCQVLGVDMNYFFQDMPSEIANHSPRMLIDNTLMPKNYFLETPPELTSEMQELLLNYSKIRKPSIAQVIQKLLKVLA